MKLKILITTLSSILLFSNSIWAKNMALVIGGGGEPKDHNMFFQTIMLDANSLKNWGWEITVSFADDQGFDKKDPSDLYGKEDYQKLVKDIPHSKYKGEESYFEYLDKIERTLKPQEEGQLLIRTIGHGGPNRQGKHAIWSFPLSNRMITENLFKRLKELKKKRPNLKIALVDDSCQAGNNFDKKDIFAKDFCYVTNSGFKNYSYLHLFNNLAKTYPGDSSKGITLEDIFLQFNLSQYRHVRSFPMISSDLSRNNFYRSHQLADILQEITYELHQPEKKFGTNWGQNFLTKFANFNDPLDYRLNALTAVAINTSLLKNVDPNSDMFKIGRPLSEKETLGVFMNEKCNFKTIAELTNTIAAIQANRNKLSDLNKKQFELEQRLAIVYGHQKSKDEQQGLCTDISFNLYDGIEGKNNEEKLKKLFIKYKKEKEFSKLYANHLTVVNPCSYKGVMEILKDFVLKHPSNSDAKVYKDIIEKELETKITKPEDKKKWTDIENKYLSAINALIDNGKTLEDLVTKFSQQERCLMVAEYIYSRDIENPVVKNCSDFIIKQP